jgi:predicted alternative tryptophan synthase beta-subunit
MEQAPSLEVSFGHADAVQAPSPDVSFGHAQQNAHGGEIDPQKPGSLTIALLSALESAVPGHQGKCST